MINDLDFHRAAKLTMIDHIQVFKAFLFQLATLQFAADQHDNR
jgi:hypothetical protein